MILTNNTPSHYLNSPENPKLNINHHELPNIEKKSLSFNRASLEDLDKVVEEDSSRMKSEIRKKKTLVKK